MAVISDAAFKVKLIRFMIGSQLIFYPVILVFAIIGGFTPDEFLYTIVANLPLSIFQFSVIYQFYKTHEIIAIKRNLDTRYLSWTLLFFAMLVLLKLALAIGFALFSFLPFNYFLLLILSLECLTASVLGNWVIPVLAK